MASSYRQKFSKVTFKDTDCEHEHPRQPVSFKHTDSQSQWNHKTTIKHRPASAPLHYETQKVTDNTNEDTVKFKSILKAPVVKQTHASKLRMSIQRPQSATTRVHFSEHLEQRKRITFQKYRRESLKREKNIQTTAKTTTSATRETNYDITKTKKDSNKTIKKQATENAQLPPSYSTRPLPTPKSKYSHKTSSVELPSVETVESSVDKEENVKKTTRKQYDTTVEDIVDRTLNIETDTDSQLDSKALTYKMTGDRTHLIDRQTETIQTDGRENVQVTKDNVQTHNGDEAGVHTSEVKLMDKSIPREEVPMHTEVATKQDSEMIQKEDTVSTLLREELSVKPIDHRALLLTPTPPPEQELAILDIQYCDIHRDKLVVYYCKAHATVFCPACKSLKHADCKRIRTIKDVCKWAKGGKEIKNVRGKLKILNKSINKLNESRRKDQTQLQIEISKCEQHISELRQECNSVLNRFETELYTILDKVDLGESKKINDHTSALRQVMGDMDETLKGIDEANKTKDQARIFIAMTKGTCLTNITEKTIKDVTENSYHISLNFQPENKVGEFLESVPRLGEIKIDSVQHTNESMDLPHSIKDMKVVSHDKHAIKMDEDITSCWISGSTFLADGRLVLCDHFNISIKLLETDFTKQHQLELKSRPWDVAAMSNTAIVVTLPEEQKLQFITINTELVPSWAKRTRRMCWGIAVYWDTIIVTCHDYADGEVMILDKDGHFLAQIGFDAANNNMFTLPYYVAVSSDGEKMFVTDQDSMTITCLTMDGQVIYTFTNKENNVDHKYSTKDIWLPEKLIVDEENNVLVCDYLTNTVIVLNDDGKKYRTLLKFEEDLKDGVKKFTSIAYRQETQTLALGLWNCDNIYTYKLTQ